MSIRAQHDVLSARAQRWLAALSDPMGRPANLAEPLPVTELGTIVEAAAAHGTLPVVARHLRGMISDRSVPVTGPQRPIDDALAALEQRLVAVTGQSMLLLHHGRRIAAEMVQRRVPAAVVKGFVFADRLYPAPADRSFTDIDILVPHAALRECSAVLRDLGYTAAPPAPGNSRDYEEHKWTLPEHPLVLIEVQTDLIHSPSLRSGIQFRYSDLLAVGGVSGPDATALLMLAAVHGAAGHQFERLQPVIDVLQAARGVAGPIDTDRLTTVAAETGGSAAIQTALDLAAELFNEPRARRLADAFRVTPWRRVRRMLVSPAVVLKAQSRKGGRDSWRRRALRQTIRKIGRIGATVGR